MFILSIVNYSIILESYLILYHVYHFLPLINKKGICTDFGNLLEYHCPLET